MSYRLSLSNISPHSNYSYGIDVVPCLAITFLIKSRETSWRTRRIHCNLMRVNDELGVDMAQNFGPETSSPGCSVSQSQRKDFYTSTPTWLECSHTRSPSSPGAVDKESVCSTRKRIRFGDDCCFDNWDTVGLRFWRRFLQRHLPE